MPTGPLVVVPTGLLVVVPMVMCARNSFGAPKSGPDETGPTVPMAMSLVRGLEA